MNTLTFSAEFRAASGRYYDNDRKAFAAPHPDALDPSKNRQLIDTLELQQHF